MFPLPAMARLLVTAALGLGPNPHVISLTIPPGGFQDGELIWSRHNVRVHNQATVSLDLIYDNDRFRLVGSGGGGNCMVHVDEWVSGNFARSVYERCRISGFGDVVVEGSWRVSGFRRSDSDVSFSLTFNGEVWDEIVKIWPRNSNRGATLGTISPYTWNVQGQFVSPALRQRQQAEREAALREWERQDAERRRIAQQQAEQQRLAQQQAEQQRIAQQQAEQQRLAQQRAQQQRIAQQQAEQQRLAQQQAQQQQAVSQSASGERFVNVSRGKQATQSSTGFDAPADRAIDGNRDGDFWKGSVTHTAEGGRGSWQVDLGAIYDIDRVQIFNRTDCCTERLQAALIVTTIPVIRDVGEAVFVQRLGDMANRSSLVVHVNVRGRYVSIVQQTGEFLHLAEVEVLVKSQ